MSALSAHKRILNRELTQQEKINALLQDVPYPAIRYKIQMQLEHVALHVEHLTKGVDALNDIDIYDVIDAIGLYDFDLGVFMDTPCKMDALNAAIILLATQIEVGPSGETLVEKEDIIEAVDSLSYIDALSVLEIAREIEPNFGSGLDSQGRDITSDSSPIPKP